MTNNTFDLELFKKELKELMIKHDVSLEVEIDGDTHSVSTRFNVRHYERDGKKYKEHTYNLVPYESYLYPNYL